MYHVIRMGEKKLPFDGITFKRISVTFPMREPIFNWSCVFLSRSFFLPSNSCDRKILSTLDLLLEILCGIGILSFSSTFRHALCFFSHFQTCKKPLKMTRQTSIRLLVARLIHLFKPSHLWHNQRMIRFQFTNIKTN